MPQSGDGLLPGAHCHDPGQGGDWLRVEAALLLAEGQPELAAQKARDGLEAMAEFYDRGWQRLRRSGRGR